MSITTVLPAVAFVTFIACLVAVASASRVRLAWIPAALASAAFLAFSVVAVATEGPLGFWPVHTASLWGNQVWLDLLLAAFVGFVALAPRARAVGMSLGVWAVLLPATGSIGLLAMLARLLYLEARPRAPISAA